MPSGPLRRSQLISPFGVGALHVGRDGVSLISAGLDHWYSKDGPPDPQSEDELNEFKFSEWRLERSLGVNHFRMPADYRVVTRFQQQHVPNKFLTQPFLRFPQWHYCRHCRTLAARPLTEIGTVKCESNSPKHKGGNGRMVQVPYVAICSLGHIQDFPWREFVHRELSPSCSEPMQLISRGTVGLGSERVKCGCGKERSLGTVLNTDKIDGVGLLSDMTTRGDTGARGNDDPPYLCSGLQPWLGQEQGKGDGCGELLHGALRGASNVYFPHTRSSIYIPRGMGGVINSEIVPLIDTPLTMAMLRNIEETFVGVPVPRETILRSMVVQLRNAEIKEKFVQYTDEQIIEALDIVLAETGVKDNTAEEDAPEVFMREEFDVLKEPRSEPDLEVRSVPTGKFTKLISDHFEKVMLVDKLRETRTLVGFSRVFEENQMTIADLKGMLRTSSSEGSNQPGNWLPAYRVFGEGILFEFREDLIADWEKGARTNTRLSALLKRHHEAQQKRHAIPRPTSRRLVLVHTFAHVMINALTFHCGYNAASLRERLYVSDDADNPMAAVLLYTASGDADGTMGGLVRMGRPGFLEPVIESAISDATWCSADPVCMEIGSSAGQGPDSCNLAACHNCALVPETSCEVFNKLLDRATLVGDLEDRSMGFFSRIL